MAATGSWAGASDATQQFESARYDELDDMIRTNGTTMLG